MSPCCFQLKRYTTTDDNELLKFYIYIYNCSWLSKDSPATTTKFFTSLQPQHFVGQRSTSMSMSLLSKSERLIPRGPCSWPQLKSSKTCLSLKFQVEEVNTTSVPGDWLRGLTSKERTLETCSKSKLRNLLTAKKRCFQFSFLLLLQKYGLLLLHLLNHDLQNQDSQLTLYCVQHKICPHAFSGSNA